MSNKTIVDDILSKYSLSKYGIVGGSDRKTVLLEAQIEMGRIEDIRARDLALMILDEMIDREEKQEIF